MPDARAAIPVQEPTWKAEQLHANAFSGLSTSWRIPAALGGEERASDGTNSIDGEPRTSRELVPTTEVPADTIKAALRWKPGGRALVINLPDVRAAGSEELSQRLVDAYLLKNGNCDKAATKSIVIPATDYGEDPSFDRFDFEALCNAIPVQHS